MVDGRLQMDQDKMLVRESMAGQTVIRLGGEEEDHVTPVELRNVIGEIAVRHGTLEGLQLLPAYFRGLNGWIPSEDQPSPVRLLLIMRKSHTSY